MSRCCGTSGSVLGQEQKKARKKTGMAHVYHSAWKKYKVFVSWYYSLAGHNFGVIVGVCNKFGSV